MKCIPMLSLCFLSLIMYNFICGMDEERQALVPFSPATTRPATDPLRQRVELKLNNLKDLEFARSIKLTHRKDMNTARVIRSINSHSHQGSVDEQPWIDWTRVVKDLQESSEIVGDIPTVWMGALATSAAINTGLFSYSFGYWISNLYQYVSSENSSVETSLVGLCSVPLGVATGLNVSVLCKTLYKLARSTGPHKGYVHCPIKTLDFKNFLITLKDQKDLSQEQSQALILDKNFSETEGQLINYAQDSALLGDGAIHTGAFKASLQRSYPLSADMCKEILAAALVSAFISQIVPCVEPPPISILPLVYNSLTVLASFYLLRDINLCCCGKRKAGTFDEIIDTIRTPQQQTNPESDNISGPDSRKSSEEV